MYSGHAAMFIQFKSTNFEGNECKMRTRICKVFDVFDFCRLKPILCQLPVLLAECCVCVATYVSLCNVNGMYLCPHVMFLHCSFVFTW